MILDLMGVPTDLPLYDKDGNQLTGIDVNIDYVDETEVQELQKLLDLVKRELSEVDDIGTDLSVSDDVNVYDFDPEREGTTGQEYYTVTIFGGKNGSGIWSNYLRVLSELLLRLEAAFDDAWVRKMDIDVTDDVFSVEIAVLTWKDQLEADLLESY